MATLKREVKKLPSEQNLRLLSSLIVSLANKQSSLEDKCIAPWKADETYQKDISYVSHNGYVYICSVTNQDSVFTESHWVKLSDNITELTKADIEAMLNLSQEELDNLQKLLKDNQITTTSTFSSSKIYTDLQAAIETAKTYTNNQLGKCVKPAYKVVASTSEVTETGYFYLISNGTNYDMYVLSADGSVVSLGTSDVDLSDYAKLTDLDNYYDKSTSDGKFATITTVDNHIDDTDVHVTKELKDKLLTTDDIATTIGSSSTDDTIPTSKAIYDTCVKDNNIKTYTTLGQLGLVANCTVEDIFLAMPENSYFEGAIADDVKNTPNIYGLLSIRKRSRSRFSIEFKICAQSAVLPNTLYIGQLKGDDGTGLTWHRVCTTSVADVPKTTLKSLSGGRFIETADSDVSSYYIVKNGICSVSIDITTVNPVANTWYELYKLPKPAGGLFYTMPNYLEANDHIYTQLKSTGSLLMRYNASTSGKRFVGTFSYPVAES